MDLSLMNLRKHVAVILGMRRTSDLSIKNKLLLMNELVKSLRSWPWWRWSITGLSLLAAILSITLSWHFLSGDQMIGCSGGSPCDQVLQSKWSMLGGILPLSSLAVGVYLALFVSGFYIGPNTEESVRKLAWKAMLVLVGAVAGSAMWLIIVQKWIIGSFCPYCMTTHISGLILTVLVVWRALKEPAKIIQVTKRNLLEKTSSTEQLRMFRPFKAIGLFLIGLTLSGLLVAFQIGVAPSEVYKDGESRANIPTLDLKNAPMIGSEDALYKVTMFFDYNCTHCQNLHFMLQEVVNRYEGKLAVVLCPTPLNTKCNPHVPRDVDAFKNSCELAEISLAVWSANREVFADYENWMFTYESGDRWQPRTTEATRAKAIELIGLAKFESALSNPWIGQYIQTSVQFFGQTLQGDKGGIPKLVYGSRWVIPEPEKAEDLISILQKSLALPI